MNAKVTTLKGILLIALLALALTACGMQAEVKDFASQPASVLAAAPAEEAVKLPATGKPVAMIQTLTRIYRSPNVDEVIDVRTPSQQPIQLVGRSADGAWLATGDLDNPERVTGWVPVGEVAVSANIESLPVLKYAAPKNEAQAAPATVIFAKVYFSPNVGSQVVGVLTPNSKIAPYARTSDGDWLAVSESDGSAAGWIQAGDVKLPAGAGELPVIYGP